MAAWREFSVAEEDTERARLAVELVAEYADAVRRAGTPMAAGEERLLLDQVTAELAGLGRLQTLLVDDTIEEVHILGCDQVRITRHGGGVDWADPIADSDDELVEILQAAAAERARRNGPCPPRNPPWTCNCPTAADWPRCSWSATARTR